MRVSRAQAEENRQNVIDTAGLLFREHGFDGIGLKDLMHEAGLTQGAFYKQFNSKDDLIAHASERALESAKGVWQRMAARTPQDPLGGVVEFYLSPTHRDHRMEGCPVVALGADAARKGPEVKAAFESGIRTHLAQLGAMTGADAEDPRVLTMLATMVGALVLSRAVNDQGLSDTLLASARASVLEAAPTPNSLTAERPAAST